MRISTYLLRLCDIEGMPVEEEAESSVDDFGEDGWVYDLLPSGSRGEDRFSTKEEEKECR